MQQLFLLLYQYRATLIFILFEVLCVWLIVQNNFYQRARFFNSSNAVAANILAVSNNIGDYFALEKVNQQLAEENASLRELLQYGAPMVQKPDSALFADSAFIAEDSAAVIQFEYITAQVISNSIRRLTNYITINKGSADGVERGMGVIGPEGVVGNVKAVSENFAVINSLLHTDIQISAKVKRTQDLGTVRWNGVDFTTASLRYVPRHVELQPGDTVVTSGYNALFPQGIMIGVVKSIEEREETQFYDITIDLAVDFNELSYVYVIKNLLRPEIDSLKTEAIEWLPQE